MTKNRKISKSNRRLLTIQLSILILVLCSQRLSVVSTFQNFNYMSSSERQNIKSETFCPPGCLKCEEKICLLCDFYSGYSLVISSCRNPNDLNCLLHNHDDKCLQCSSGYYYNSIDEKCLKLVEDELINDCDLYSGPLTCNSCKSDFMIKNASCIKKGQVELISDFSLKFYK